MRILVLTKPVPDPAAGAERLGPDFRLDRAASPSVVNGNDEYALEAALQLVEAHGGEVAILSMAPANGTDTMRKALAMGAQRGVLVTDPALEGADMAATIRVLAAAAAAEEFDLLLAGLDTSDGQGGAVAAGVAARLGLPLLSTAAAIEPDPATGRVRVRRLSAKGYDVIEAPMPAVISCTQALGAPRYPSLKGIMAARSREIAQRSVADAGRGRRPGGRRVVDAGHGGGGATRPCRGTRRAWRAGRGRTRGRRLPRGAEADLMPPVILAVAEVADGAPTKLSTEVATLARATCRGRRRRGGRPGRRCGTGRHGRRPRHVPAARRRGHLARGRRRGLGTARRGRGPAPRRRGRHPHPRRGDGGRPRPRRAR